MAICLTFGLFSCQEEKKEEGSEQEQEQEQEVREEKPKLHLKEMMRLMFNDMMVNREKIINDEEELHFSFDYSQMPHAEATTPENAEKSYYQEEMDKFIKLQKQLAESRDRVKRSETFNTMKSTCVSCHQEYCIGPLRKIKKIHLLENPLLN